MKTFKQYLQAQSKTQSTVKHYVTYLNEYKCWLQTERIETQNASTKEVLAFLSQLQKRGQSNKTRCIRLGVLKHFFNWQLETGQRPDHPIRHLKIQGVQRKRLYHILDKDELQHLYGSYVVPIDSHPKSHRNWFESYQLSRARNKAILSLMTHQGLTTPEIQRMEVSDLKLQDGRIYIKGSRKNRERTLDLKSNQILVLVEYIMGIRPRLREYQEETEKLFLSTPASGKNTATENLDIWKNLTKELKLLNPNFINFQQVRTSIITEWLTYFNLRKVQYLAGHKYVHSTEEYIVNQSDDLKEDIDRFHPMG